MCGIFAFIGKENQTADPNKLKVLALYNASRGTDATGLLTLEKDQFKVIKNLDNSFKFTVDNPSKYEGNNILIGHTRAKTVGQNTYSNAHPFTGNMLGGVHNGTLTNHEYMYYVLSGEKSSTLPGRKSIAGDPSDSKLFYEMMNDAGYQKIIESYEGAAALVFIDKHGVMYAYRDKGRVLHCGVSEEGMYISSQHHPLEAIGCKDICYFEEEYIYRLSNGEITSKDKVTRQPMIAPKPVVPAVPVSKKPTNVLRLPEGPVITSPSESTYVVSQQEIASIKAENREMENTPKNHLSGVVFSGTENEKTVIIPYSYLIPVRRVVKMGDDKRKSIITYADKYSNVISCLQSNCVSHKFDCGFVHKDQKTGEYYLHLEFRDPNNQILSSFVTISILKSWAEKTFPSYFSGQDITFESVKTNIKLMGIPTKNISNLLSIELRRICAISSMNLPLHSLVDPIVNGVKGEQSIIPFVPDNVNTEEFSKQTAIKEMMDGEHIIKVDNKYILCRPVSYSDHTHRLSLRPIDPDSAGILIEVNANRIMTPDEYVQDLSENYDELCDKLDNDFFDGNHFTDYDKLAAIEAIFAGAPLELGYDVILDELIAFRKDNDFITMNGKDRLTKAIRRISNLKMRNMTIYQKVTENLLDHAVLEKENV
jgi:predicted glutamine amidotransferase